MILHKRLPAGFRQMTEEGLGEELGNCSLQKPSGMGNSCSLRMSVLQGSSVGLAGKA